ncbi:MAG TPA: preprotein translocase subunit SecY [Saprospiraceae bacterium]|nr:preprotein translocase subunit SecY [Saprospiraceae bacterium]MCB9269726.1 preprotein translocase subunit SecY [Lewinellaceae bacterium]MCB0673065.1 preprotein translocase subunit SecY [Saprospiraceae bacterium]MCB9321293.1 preprotein translocase subunit SecY [Lewinellaceae bacterium]HPG06608.1 preprotein translocase subunit SecY [Saprospiraceae bacterium]
MKKLIETLKNIWKIQELRKRILYTLGLILVYRFGKYVVIPGVNATIMQSAINQAQGKDLLGLINNFTGGAFSSASVFALGIMPYITASIIVQLLGFAVPYFQRLQQHEGESGRKKLNQITRLLTVAITLVQGGGYLTLVKNMGAVDPNIAPGLFWFSGIIILSSGTIFAMWLGEKITDRGIGNGISMLIMIGIIANIPSALLFEFSSRVEAGGALLFVLELALFFLVIVATILIVQGVRKIPIQFAKRMVGRGNINMPVSGNRDYIPLKVNAAGVMPIIFAQAIMFLPATIAGWLSNNDSSIMASGFMQQLTNPFSFLSSVFAFLLVVVFTFVYTALIVNPKQYSEYLKRQNAFIPGVKPGKDTADFIDEITTRVTLPGSIFLGLITIIPAIAFAFGVSQRFAHYFGGTSLLILVAVVLDTLQQIESYLLMRKYDGLVKSGRIKGRSGSGMQIGASM